MVPPVSIGGTTKINWIDPVGNVRDLTRATSPTVFMTDKPQGLGAAIFDLATDKLPRGAGTFVRHINTEERTIELPIYVQEETFEDLLNKIEDIHNWFATGSETEKTPGYLQIIRADESVRQILCYYVEGLDSPEEAGPNWARFVIRLYAPDPYPTADADIVTEYTVAEALNFGVINPGKLEAYPIWKLTAPWTTNVTIRNNTYDPDLVIVLGGLATGFFIIDTRPSDIRPGFSVYDNLGANRIGDVSPSVSTFWTLKSGLNALQVGFFAGTTAATRVELTYLPRYRSLYR